LAVTTELHGGTSRESVGPTSCSTSPYAKHTREHGVATKSNMELGNQALSQLSQTLQPKEIYFGHGSPKEGVSAALKNGH